MSLIVNTPCGPVQGAPGKQPGTVAFKGIRYATAERFAYPNLVTQWDGVYDATDCAPICLQGNAFREGKESRFYYNEFRRGVSVRYAEDSLTLNIFAPEDAKNAPVLVYVHGGAFLHGSSNQLNFHNPVWPQKGVIAVTLNYRLNLFGRQLPGDEASAFHSADLWYRFGSLPGSWRPSTDWDYRLSEIMTDYLTSFARTGDPNGPDLPRWDSGCTDNAVMCLGDDGVGMQTVVPETLKAPRPLAEL